MSIVIRISDDEKKNGERIEKKERKIDMIRKKDVVSKISKYIIHRIERKKDRKRKSQ